MTQSECEKKKPKTVVVLSFLVSLGTSQRARSEARHEPAPLRTLGSPGAGWFFLVCKTRSGIGFETGFEAGFVFGVRGRFPFQKRNRAVAQVRAVEFYRVSDLGNISWR